MPVRPGVQFKGNRQFQRQVSRAVDRDLPKRIGQVNKDVGTFVRDRLQPPPTPAAVGASYGATVRPSATRREVILRVGGGHRADVRWPGQRLSGSRTWWGRSRGNTNVSGQRPNIIGTAEQHEDTIVRMLAEGYERALKPPFE